MSDNSPVFMASASYRGEALMLSRSVSEGNNRIRTTSSSNNEVGRVLPDIPRPWHALVKISTNRFDCYRMLHCFSVLLIVCLVVYYRRRKILLQKYLNRFDLHIVETLKENFIHSKRDHFTISISDKCSKNC